MGSCLWRTAADGAATSRQGRSKPPGEADLAQPLLATLTPPASIALFALAALVGAVGQYLYKSGADAATGGLMSYVLNARLWGGVACYVAVMVLFVRAFKLGGALTTLYPVYASTFAWAALIAWFALGTPIKPINVVGMGLLVAGMYCMGK